MAGEVVGFDVMCVVRCELGLHSLCLFYFGIVFVPQRDDINGFPDGLKPGRAMAGP
jgi:hypothetical protein